MTDTTGPPDRPETAPAGDPPLDGGYSDPHVENELRKFATEFLLYVDPKGELRGGSAYNTLGYDGYERTGHHIAEHIHPDDLPMIFDIIERARRTPGFDETVLARARHKDGSWRVFEARIYDAALRSDLVGSVLRVRDITDERAEQAGREEIDGAEAGNDDAARFLSLAEMLPIGILSGDARGWVAYCNEAAQQILNLPADFLLGHGWEKAVSEDDRADVVSAAGQALSQGVPREAIFRIVTGLFQRWAHAKFVPLGGPDGSTGWIATIEDITERRRVEGELAYQATHDALTGLPNRMLLEDRLRQASGRLRRDSTSISLFFIDLDGFKEINDTHGHQAGDEVLIEVARRLREIMRDIDTVARLGGDEFVAVCESLPEDEMDQVTERITRTFEVPLLVGGVAMRIGASTGSARTADPTIEVADLLALADQAMYRDKAAHKEADTA